MSISEKILLLFSHPFISSEQYQNEWNIDNALFNLNRCFPNFMDYIIGKKICDLGCGLGYQAVALKIKGAHYVLGVDINPADIEKARQVAAQHGLEDKVLFIDKTTAEHKNSFDVVISQNSMEHFDNPALALEEMKSLLTENGVLFITFGPLWYAPYGSHMNFFTKLPWVNILFSEKTVMNVRKRFREETIEKLTYTEAGLNKITVNKFEKIIKDSGLRVKFLKYRCVKELDFLGRLPAVRELFINQIDCIVLK